MISLLVYLTAVVFGGSALVRWAFGRARTRRSPLVLELILGSGIAIGASSCTLFLTGLAFDALRPHGILVELSLLVCMAAALVFLAPQIRFRSMPKTGPRNRPPLRARVAHGVLLAGLSIALTTLLVLATVLFLQLAAEKPHGSWDAWAFWNTRARFFFHSQHDWTAGAFSNSQIHADYPLLLPLTVARLWCYLGDDPTIVPRAIGLLSLLGVTSLLIGSLATLRSLSQGLLAGIILLATDYLVELGTWQYADLPLAYYILATCVLLAMGDRLSERRGHTLLLAGTTAALAAWTKNEGLLFVTILLAVQAVCTSYSLGWRRGLRESLLLVLGGLPVLTVLVFFKVAHAPANDILLHQSLPAVFERLTTASRYVEIAKTLWRDTRDLLGLLPCFLPVFAICIGMRPRSAIGRGAVIASITTAGLAVAYFFVYLTTPNQLQWHLETSSQRLLLHFWPAVLFLFFEFVATPESTRARRVWRLAGGVASGRDATRAPQAPAPSCAGASSTRREAPRRTHAPPG